MEVKVAETASDSSHTTSENPHGLQPQMRIQAAEARMDSKEQGLTP